MTFGRKFITVLTSFIVDHFTIGDLHSFFSAFGSVAGHFKDIVQHDVGQDFKNILNNKKGQAIHPHKKDVVRRNGFHVTKRPSGSKDGGAESGHAKRHH